MGPDTLSLTSERAVYQAMFECLDGGLTARSNGEATLDADDGSYRLIDGVCFAAPDTSLVGAELVGWLVESDRASAVMTRWRRGARAVFVKTPAVVSVTPASTRLHVDGEDVADGYVTHEGRFVLVHGERKSADRAAASQPPPASSQPPPRSAIQASSQLEPEADPAAMVDAPPETPVILAGLFEVGAPALDTDHEELSPPASASPEPSFDADEPRESYAAPLGVRTTVSLPPLGPMPSFAQAVGDGLTDLTSDDELESMTTQPQADAVARRRSSGE